MVWRLFRCVLHAGIALALVACGPAGDAREASGCTVSAGEVALADLPREARDTLVLIRKGGPFHYRKDGSTFGNREGHLPHRPRGYYTEYTVPTPWERDRGARRIVAGRATPAIPLPAASTTTPTITTTRFDGYWNETDARLVNGARAFSRTSTRNEGASMRRKSSGPGDPLPSHTVRALRGLDLPALRDWAKARAST